MIFEILLIVLLTVANGVLSMSELAVVSSRPARLASMAEKGDRGAQVALGLLEQPGKFLSSVQIGITLVGVLTGAVSGATLGAAATAPPFARTHPATWFSVGKSRNRRFSSRSRP